MKLSTDPTFTVRLEYTDAVFVHHMDRKKFMRFWFSFGRFMRNGTDPNNIDEQSEFMIDSWRDLVTDVEVYETEEDKPITELDNWRDVVVMNVPVHVMTVMNQVISELGEQARLPVPKKKSLSMSCRSKPAMKRDVKV